MGFKNDLPNEGSECCHVAVNEPKVPQPSTIRRSRTIIKSVLWFVAKRALVAEIWPFQVLQGTPRGGYTMTCPACMEQAVPSLTPPRDYQSPRGAGARSAGLDKLFFGYLFL